MGDAGNISSTVGALLFETGLWGRSQFKDLMEPQGIVLVIFPAPRLG